MTYTPPPRVTKELQSVEDIRGLDVYPGDTVAVGFRTSNQGDLRVGKVLAISSVEGNYLTPRIDVEVEWFFAAGPFSFPERSTISPARIVKIELPDA